MNGVKSESAQCVKDLGVTITSNLKFFQQYKDAAGKANRILDFIKQTYLLKKIQILFYHYLSVKSDPNWNMPWSFGHQA